MARVPRRAPSSSSMPPADSSSDVGSSSSGLTGMDTWRLCLVFSLDDRQVQLDAPWDDSTRLWNVIPQHFQLPVASIEYIHYVPARPLDLELDNLECLLLQRQADAPTADFLRLTLVDVEYQADRHGPVMRIQRRARWIT